MIRISAFKWVPEFTQGQCATCAHAQGTRGSRTPLRDPSPPSGRSGQAGVRLRALQPFGQVPILEEDGLVLFESGAIVLHIGERSETLLPQEPGARARATRWLISALNSIEPFMMNVAVINVYLRAGGMGETAAPRCGGIRAKAPVEPLEVARRDKPFLDGDRFTAGDLMMTTVLRILKHTDIVTRDPRLAAYIERCTSRPRSSAPSTRRSATSRKRRKQSPLPDLNLFDGLGFDRFRDPHGNDGDIGDPELPFSIPPNLP